MKARKVKGLDAGAPLIEGARRIVGARLEEVHSFVPAALDPDQPEALHDMRIALKRLRYVLEVTGHLFGAPAKATVKEAKALQDLLGDIHDCDEMQELIDAHSHDLRAEDSAAIRRALSDGSAEIAPAMLRHAPNRRAYRGLASLASLLRARRQQLFVRFAREWERLEHEDLRGRLELALAE